MISLNSSKHTYRWHTCGVALWLVTAGLAPAQEQLQLTGIAAVLPPKRAFVLVGRSGGPPQSRTLLDGQVLANGAVVAVDERAGCVTLRRGAVCETLRFNSTSSSSIVIGDDAHRPILSSASSPDANP